MLKQLLEQKNCFKLICGAGNENLDEVEKLVAVYAKAGCRFFDFAANEDVLKAAQRGLSRMLDLVNGQNGEQKDYHFCVSVGTQNDKHFKKAKINPEKCKRCEQCIRACPRNAINSYFKVIKDKCIGCSKCFYACKHGALEMYSCHAELGEASLTKEILRLAPQNDKLISCVELHVSDKDSAIEMWDKLCDEFFPMMSICIAKDTFSPEQTYELLKKMVAKRPPYTVIIQADGNPMSGGEDDFDTTRSAVESGKFIKGINLPVYLFLSGGTNSKTAELAKQENLDITGVAIGSYARKIVKQFVENVDFWNDKNVFEGAVKVAQKLVKSV